MFVLTRNLFTLNSKTNKFERHLSFYIFVVIYSPSILNTKLMDETLSGHEKGSFEQFLQELDRLVSECERRKDVTDHNVLRCMLHRLTSCKSAVESVTVGVRLKIQGLLCRFR